MINFYAIVPEAKKNTDQPNIIDDFIKRLSIETIMSRDKSKEIVSLLYDSGNLEDAIKSYNEYGIEGIFSYIIIAQHPELFRKSEVI